MFHQTFQHSNMHVSLRFCTLLVWYVLILKPHDCFARFEVGLGMTVVYMAPKDFERKERIQRALTQTITIQDNTNIGGGDPENDGL